MGEDLGRRTPGPHQRERQPGAGQAQAGHRGRRAEEAPGRGVEQGAVTGPVGLPAEERERERVGRLRRRPRSSSRSTSSPARSSSASASSSGEPPVRRARASCTTRPASAPGSRGFPPGSSDRPGARGRRRRRGRRGRGPRSGCRSSSRAPSGAPRSPSGRRRPRARPGRPPTSTCQVGRDDGHVGPAGQDDGPAQVEPRRARQVGRRHPARVRPRPPSATATAQRCPGARTSGPSSRPSPSTPCCAPDRSRPTRTGPSPSAGCTAYAACAPAGERRHDGAREPRASRGGPGRGGARRRTRWPGRPGPSSACSTACRTTVRRPPPERSTSTSSTSTETRGGPSGTAPAAVDDRERPAPGQPGERPVGARCRVRPLRRYSWTASPGARRTTASGPSAGPPSFVRGRNHRGSITLACPALGLARPALLAWITCRPIRAADPARATPSASCGRATSGVTGLRAW